MRRRGRSAPTYWRPRKATSSTKTARSSSRAPHRSRSRSRRSPLRRSRPPVSRRAWRAAWRRPPSSIPRTSSGRSVPISASSKSIPRPARRKSFATLPSTTSAPGSTRWWSTASSMAGSPRASAKPGQPAGHQGRRGSGNDRLHPGCDERHRRCARAVRGQGPGDAGHPAETLGADAPQRRDKTMTPAAFDYVAPRTLPEAVAELVKHGPEGKVLAGGHSLIPLMKLRLSTPSFLVDIGRIGNLSYIREEDGRIAIGALTSHHDIEFSDLLKNKLPLLTSAASQIGDPQVRNRGTIGGAAAHADPNGDFPACLLALDAEL